MVNLRSAAFLSLAVLTPVFVHAAEPKVSADVGNIVFANRDGQTQRLTSSAHDSEPVLSPDGKWVVFVRAVPGKKIATGGGEEEATELWQIRADGKEPTLLVRAHESEKMESVIGGFENLQFSSDGRLVFFVTPAWATSGAVHVVDTTNAKEHFVVAGNNLEIVPSGEYRDHLLLQQHRYFLGGGSYDWFFLFKPDGKEVGVVGEDTSNFKELYSDK